MRLDPINILLNKDFTPNKKFYLISGNEATLIEKIRVIIVEYYKNKENAVLKSINSINDFVEQNGLFDEKEILLVKNSKGLQEKIIHNLRNKNCVFLIIEENSKSIKKIKNIFLKDSDCCLIDCYELNKESKTKIINKFLDNSELIIEKSLYWFLIEKLDSRYIFLENSLNKIIQLDQKDINLVNINKLLSIDDTGKGKLFFILFKKNKEIISAYREKIVFPSDVNEFFYYCKFYCELIIECKNEYEFIKKIPIYLFREKNYLIDIYRKYSFKKKKLLLELLISTEKVLRKENNLSLISGIRFLLSVKKITIS